MPPVGPDGFLTRVALGAVAAAAVAVLARRARTLSTGGSAAAVLVGTICAGAGWDWVALVMVFFVTSSLWSRIDRRVSGSVVSPILAKGGAAMSFRFWPMAASTPHAQLPSSSACAREAWPARCAGYLGRWHAAGAGALAAATADTWATEVGTAWGGTPRSIVTGHHLIQGTSGGVTTVGTVAGVAGGALVAVVSWGLGWGWPVAAAAAVGGLVGLLGDSLLGATLQQRRWCDRCNSATEQARHLCGTLTRVSGGLRWLDNDGVNAVSSLVGAWMAWIVGRSLS